MVAPPALPGPHVLDQGGVGRRVDGDGLLHETVEQLPTMARRAPVEPERELVEVVVQVGSRHGALMRPEQPALQERDDPMHPWQQLGRGLLPAFQERDAVPIAVLLQSVIAEEPVGVEHAARRHRLLDERLEAVGCRVGDPTHANPADTLAVFFTSHSNQSLFLGLASTDAFLDAADEGLIDFDHARQPFAIRADHRSPELMQPRPRGFVAAQAEHLLQPDGARHRLLAGDPPHGAEPCRQRRPGVLEDRPGRHRRLAATGGTLKEPPHGARLGPAALRTVEPVRPPQLHQVGAAGVRRREAALEFVEGPRIIFHRPVRYVLGSP